MSNVIPIGKTAVLNAINTIKEEPKLSEDELIDNKIAGLASHDGWKYLKESLEAEINRLNEIADNYNPGKDTVESVGFKFLACSLAKHKLQGVIDRVEQTRKAVSDRVNSRDD